MKIAVISSTVFPVSGMGLLGYGGLEQIAFQVARGLAEKKHHVAFIAPDGSDCPGAETIHTGPPGHHDEKQAYDKYWKRLPQYDVIIDHSWMKHAFILKMEGHLKAPVLAVCHAPVNTMFQSMPNLQKPCFVCISEDQANHFRALFNREAKVAHNGIDLNFYKNLNVPRTGRFLFLARFSQIKGADLAIEACKRAGAELDLIGDTSITNEGDYFQQCRRQCDGKQIRMVGPARRGDCVYWYSSAHALLHPVMRFREPFGLAPVEAMACGCPVVAWDHGAMRETVKWGDSGFLVHSMDEMTQAIETMKGKTLGEFRLRARQQAENFSVQKMVNRYEELCVNALETGGW